MPREYKSGFERLARQFPDTEDRYSRALEAIKANFKGFTKRAGYDSTRPDKLSESHKRQIRKYYNILSLYTEGSDIYKMKPTELPKKIKEYGAKGTDAVMRAAQMQYGRKRAKFIFIKYDGENVPRIDIRNGSPVFVNDKTGFAKEVIELNTIQLARDVGKTLDAVAPLVQGAKLFRILNGRYDFGYLVGLGAVKQEIERLQNKYVIGSKDSWDRWLHGIAAYYSDTLTPSKIVRYEDEHRKRFQNRKRKGK